MKQNTQIDLNHFKKFLREELIRRCQKNPSYSLRAFAKSLDVDFSALSKMINGKRVMGPKMVTKLGMKLGLSPKDVSAYLLKNKYEHFQAVELDSFELISNWYHYAILELVQVKQFKPSIKWIASRLGCNVHEITEAVERLIRLNLLKIDGDQWTCLINNTTTVHAFTTQAFRNLQKQVLEKAIKALEEVPMEKRDQSSMTMAIDIQKIPEAKERIKKFRRDLNKFLSTSENKTEVYNLSVSLYPITKEEK